MASIFSRPISFSSVTCICALNDDRTIARIASPFALCEATPKVGQHHEVSSHVVSQCDAGDVRACAAMW